ncbi:RNAse P, Rpr2/Rpp21 subunit [Ignicoccus pacificus DSM 13166]|uniref:Ribonuclease P protein component 4 n=1 Tax=Ignicoccus pacificus DSM 13166 TaxID=940294 RepID=A0A977PJ96_9CREN|nr:RNAse P, Rpr2/Rpp21 subunit [Ignicoccus pacificus DSM 13166]
MKSRKLLRDLAKQRFWNLYHIAFEEAEKGNFQRASEIMRSAFKIAKKGGYKVPRYAKRSVCRRCFVPLIPGRTLRVRIRNKGIPTVVRACLNCGYVRRYPVASVEGTEGKTISDEAHGPHREERLERSGAQRDKEAT